jgi:hypothetical protein
MRPEPPVPHTNSPAPEPAELPAASGGSSASVLQLGHYPLAEHTVEHDLSVQERYQAFSAELLRISLLGLGVLGVGFTNLLFPAATITIEITPVAQLGVATSLLGFAVSAGAALVHRYSSVDSLSWHVQSLRRDVRGAAGDSEAAKIERVRRYKQFVVARNALRVSAVSLGVAAAVLAGVLIELLVG